VSTRVQRFAVAACLRRAACGSASRSWCASSQALPRWLSSWSSTGGSSLSGLAGGHTWSAFLPVIVLAALFLSPRWLGVVLAATALLLAYDGWSLGSHRGDYAGEMIVILVMAAMMTWLAVSRLG